jgi:Divergent InlB B-repeat domain
VQAAPTFTAGSGTCFVNTACTVAVASNPAGGTPPYYFSSDTFANGVPPLGMAVGLLSGVLTGTLTVPGTYSFGVCVVDLVGNSTCKQVSVTVNQGFTLTTAVTGTGSGTVSANPPGGPTYAAGTIVTLTASPASGSTFAGWSGGGCSGTGSCVVTMNANQTVTATFDSSTPLTGSWVGTWTWSGTGSNGCTFNDGGAFSMTLAQNGTSFSGSTNGAGVQTRDNTTCALTNTGSASGTASGTISGTSVNISFDLVGQIATLNFSGTATLNNNTLTGSFQRDTGGSGSFSLTKQ